VRCLTVQQSLLLELRLLGQQRLHRVRIDALVLGGKIIELLFQREIVGTKFIHPGLVHRAFGIQEKRAVALDVKGEMFRRNFVLGLVFEFESHDA
jgi:hypothetical protein